LHIVPFCGHQQPTAAFSAITAVLTGPQWDVPDPAAALILPRLGVALLSRNSSLDVMSSDTTAVLQIAVIYALYVALIMHFAFGCAWSTSSLLRAPRHKAFLFAWESLSGKAFCACHQARHVFLESGLHGRGSGAISCPDTDTDNVTAHPCVQ
jgi:hypothetical protein